MVYLTSLVFSLPVFCFRSPYAAVAGLTIAHGLQYLLLTALVAAGGGGGTRRVVQLAALGNIALPAGRRCRSPPISSPRDRCRGSCTAPSSAP